MCTQIKTAVSTIEPQDLRLSNNNLTIKKETKDKEPSINTKDQKKLGEIALKPAKASNFGFVEEKDKSPNLTTHRIVGTTTKVIGEEIGKRIAEKTVVASVGKVVTKTVSKTSGETVTKALVKSVGKNTVETAIMSASEEIAVKALEKGAAKTAEKGTSQLAKRLAATAPVVGVAMEIGFTVWDAKYAYDLSKDKNVSKVSKAFAWATVGLDVVSTVATGVGCAPVSWIATGLSVGTAVLSDMFK